MFRIKKITEPSGKGRTPVWPARIGTVTGVTMVSVFVQWRDCAVEGRTDRPLMPFKSPPRSGGTVFPG